MSWIPATKAALSSKTVALAAGVALIGGGAAIASPDDKLPEQAEEKVVQPLAKTEELVEAEGFEDTAIEDDNDVQAVEDESDDAKNKAIEEDNGASQAARTEGEGAKQRSAVADRVHAAIDGSEPGPGRGEAVSRAARGIGPDADVGAARSNPGRGQARSAEARSNGGNDDTTAATDDIDAAGLSADLPEEASDDDTTGEPDDSVDNGPPVVPNRGNPNASDR